MSLWNWCETGIHGFCQQLKIAVEGFLFQLIVGLSKKIVVQCCSVRLTEKGRHVRDTVDGLFERHSEGLEKQGVLNADGVDRLNHSLKRIERFWSDQIRYIY